VPKPKGTIPSFTSELTPTAAKEGEKYKLVCKVSGEPKPTVTWFKDGKEVPLDSRVTSKFDREVGELSFKDMSLDDTGRYKCVVKNDFGSVESSADVVVEKKSRKPEVIEKMKDVDLTEGGDARFEVKLSGYPAPAVLWYRGRNWTWCYPL